MTLDEFKWTEKNIGHLASGGTIYLFCDIDETQLNADDVFIVDELECKFLGREPMRGTPMIMRYDKYLERMAEGKLNRFVDEHGFIPYELMSG